MFRLCLGLGVPHPRYLAGVLTSRDITDWQQYAQLEPFGAPADDIRQGGIAAAIYNVNRDAKKAPQPFSFHDVLPWGQRRPAVVDAAPEEQEAAFDRMFAGG